MNKHADGKSGGINQKGRLNFQKYFYVEGAQIKTTTTINVEYNYKV